MAEIKTEALILKTIPFKETSKIVRMYTRDKGKLAVIAKGASRSKSDFRGKLDPLNYIEAIIYYKESREVQTLGEIELIKSFLQKCQDYEGIYYGMAILEALDKFIDGTEDNFEVFRLTVETLKRVDREPKFAKAMLVYYLLHLADILGYRINLKRCSICDTTFQQAYYNTNVDHLICEECSRSGDLAVPAEEVDFFRMALQQEPQEIDLKPFESTNFTQAGQFLLRYLGWHMEVSPVLKSLKTLRSLK